jgi:predicted peptidase
VPIWVFHGAQDETVKPAQSEVLVEALRACGSDVRYTLLPKATHAASGVLPYRESELYDWLLQQALPEKMPAAATPEATINAGAPIESATPNVVNTPLPGDDSLKPIGQHAYAIDLNIVNAQGLTRTATISYLLYLPGGYGEDPQQQWPLILFLHGSGERGDNPEMLVVHGPPKLLTSTLDFPAIVLSPQAPEDTVWWGAKLDEVSALLDHVEANYAVDAKRIYLTGLSMGGFGAWAMAVRQPHRFAAVVPVAGGWDSERDIVPRNICDIKDVPIWVFHGAQDDIVLPKKAQLMVNALKKCGVDVRFTLYPDAKHRESFERAYDDPELYAWMFEQHLP